MPEVGSLLAHVGGGLFQQAFVVAELDAAEQALRAGAGCTDFVNLPATDLDYELRGERVRAALAIGFARSGNVQIELIQPVRGPGLHAEFLAENGPGAHHLGFLVDDLDGSVDRARDLGFAKLMGARFGSLQFCYLDTRDALGLYVELVEDPDGMMQSLMPWR
jgi:methylmalonyl-CoA/ethylmalonyl-CoA epimerase